MYGRFFLTLWCAVCLLMNPLFLGGRWSDPPCAMHGGTCTCPEMCRLMKAGPVEPEAPACHASHNPVAEVSESQPDPRPTTETACQLTSACPSERDQAVLIHAYRLLPQNPTLWIYVPLVQAYLLESPLLLRPGFPPTPFHPPKD